MKITMAQIFSYIRLSLRLWLPVTVFIGLYTGIIVAFDPVLLMLDQIAPSFMGNGWCVLLIWLSLLILYIILGVVFTRFFARFLRRSFGSEALRIQRRMAALSGLPFYAICLLCLWSTIVFMLFPDANAPAASLTLGVAGFLGFGLISLSYLLLLRFFSGRPTAIARQ